MRPFHSPGDSHIGRIAAYPFPDGSAQILLGSHGALLGTECPVTLTVASEEESNPLDSSLAAPQDVLRHLRVASQESKGLDPWSLVPQE